MRAGGRTWSSTLFARVRTAANHRPRGKGQGHEVPGADGILADRRRAAASLALLAAHGIGAAVEYRRSGVGRERRRLRPAPVLRPSARTLRGGFPGADQLRSEGPGRRQNALRLEHFGGPGAVEKPGRTVGKPPINTLAPADLAAPWRGPPARKEADAKRPA